MMESMETSNASSVVETFVPSLPCDNSSLGVKPISEDSVPYECSLVASDIDLSLRNDLSTSVQDYLMRIVDDLHQLSKWTYVCHNRVLRCEQQQTQTAMEISEQKEASRIPTQQFTVLMKTEIELLRREMQVLAHDIFQRATTQLAYVQNSFRSEYDDQLLSLHRRVNDQHQILAHKPTSPSEEVRTNHGERLSAAELALGRLQSTLDSHNTYVGKLEKELGELVSALPAMKRKHELEFENQQQQLDRLEASVMLNTNGLAKVERDLTHAVRETREQINSRLQVVQVELREHKEDQYHKVHQLQRALCRTSKQLGMTRAGFIAMPSAGRFSTELVVGSTTAEATDPADCFLHARAALPPWSDMNHESRVVKRALKINAVHSTKPGEFTTSPRARVAIRRNSSKTADVLANGGSGSECALQIHPSSIGRPLGREDDVAWSVRNTTPLSSPRKTTYRTQPRDQASVCLSPHKIIQG